MDAKIGDHATYQIGSDSYPVTIVAVKKGGRVLTAQFDKFTAGEGHDYYNRQKWDVHRNEQGRTQDFTWKPSAGYYSLKGYDHGILRLGRWGASVDPGF